MRSLCSGRGLCARAGAGDASWFHLLRHAHDKFYQAPPLFSRAVGKIGETGDEATLGVCALQSSSYATIIIVLL